MLRAAPVGLGALRQLGRRRAALVGLRVLVAVAPDGQVRATPTSALTTETPTPCRPPETL